MPSNSPYGDLSGFGSYADWQKANKAQGGSGQSNEIANWFNGGGQASTAQPQSNTSQNWQPAPSTQQPQNSGNQWTQPSAPLQNGVNLEQQFAQQRGNIDWRDPAYSQGQWGAWEAEERQRAANGQSAQTQPNKYNPDGKGCPPDKPFTSRAGPDGGVECAAKPDDCPDGSHVVGTPGRCVANGSDGAGGGSGGYGSGAGGGYGQGGGYGSGGAYDNPAFQYLRSSSLAANQDPNEALRVFMGQGGAQGYEDTIDAARQQAMALPPGPARDAAMARLEEMKVTGLGKMKQAAAGQARQDLYQVINPEQYWGGQLPLDYSKLSEQGREANMSNQLGWGNLNLNRDLGFSNLAQNQSQFDQNLGFNRWATEGNWQNNYGLAQLQAQQGQPTTAQKWLGGAADLLSTGKGIYDIYKDWKSGG